MNSKNVLKDLQSGFLVFLIALPLCIGISLASGYPAVAGILTAIVGGLIVPLISNSELTIEGPAAGLIVIVLGCITDFGFTGRDIQTDLQAYRMALSVGVVASAVQILFGALGLAALVELFPAAVVHGMLAAIGVIIFAKQFPIMLGVSAKGEPLHLLFQLPQHIANLNPEVAIIGGISLGVMIFFALTKNKKLKRIPAALVAVLVAIPLAKAFDLEHEHTYALWGHLYNLSDKFLVSVPHQLASAITFPDFSALLLPKAWKWVAMLSIIVSLESTLSAKAVDILDPKKRKTNLNRDLLGVGIANLVVTSIGGLPMISEIVRSRANIDAGAESRKSLFFHGLFLFLFVAFFPGLIHQIPLAALAALLVMTGYRLASPKEFIHMKKIGSEQLVVYAGTIVAVLATDLLVGLAIGIGIEFLVQLLLGVSPKRLFRPRFNVTETEKHVFVSPMGAAVFTHWPWLRANLIQAGNRGRGVVLDFSKTKIVDHTTMAKVNELSEEIRALGVDFTIEGLDNHGRFSNHPNSGRRLNA